MSTPSPIRRRTVNDIRKAKGGTPLVCLTAYTTPVAKILDRHADLLLVGDSLGMVVYGMESTVGVTLDMMVNHGKAVMRGAQRAFVVVDMPFGSYEESPRQAFRNAARILKETGCQAVKLEGGAGMAKTIAFLARRGVPVMAHVGLTPQSVNTLGGYATRGRNPQEARRIARDAKAVQRAGAFACVIEGTAEPVARDITRALSIPTVGIGASPACDGQILVSDDAFGMFRDFTPGFVKRFADVGGAIDAAAARYADEVRARDFPGPEHVCLPKRFREAAEPAPPTQKSANIIHNNIDRRPGNS